jgi:hypothetical protein
MLKFLVYVVGGRGIAVTFQGKDCLIFGRVEARMERMSVSKKCLTMIPNARSTHLSPLKTTISSCFNKE